MVLRAFLFAFFVPLGRASPTDVGVSVNTSSSDALPILTLPYARVQAKTYDAINDVQPRAENPATHLIIDAVLHVQKHTICSTSDRQSALARATAAELQLHAD